MEQAIKDLSMKKWDWMIGKRLDNLSNLFHEKAVFVHMGATFSKNEEIDVIKSGSIVYKDVDIQETSVRVIDTTAILLNKVQLTAVVGGNEVTNPFVVTEVYVLKDDQWKLASMSFTRLLTS
ncbi:nuclear transport factor 2 family protein [Gracilibacillus massiliensis]|uniref:nuclear transport factor 2 family protein n=1 Tax=Gracilibacillus massiliensis TaxID=1564956 RepID=UPI0009E88093|nr:nuclear transport factor 2 family protein [Gracilibacillus massiliensis]